MSRISVVVAAALAALLPFASTVLAQDDGAINPGDQVEGTIVAGIKEVVPFDGTAGSQLSLDITMAPGAQPNLVLLQPDRTPYPGLAGFGGVDAKGRKLKLKKVPLLDSGRHWLVIGAGTPGTYRLKTKMKVLKKDGFAGLVIPSPPTERTIGAVAGSLLTIKYKRGKKSGLVPEVAFVRAPSGAEVDLDRAAKHTQNEKLDSIVGLPLDETGAYVVGLSTPNGLSGDTASVSLIVKAPKVKKAKRVDTDIVVDPIVDAVTPARGFDNRQLAMIGLSGDFITPGATVRLEGPGGTINGTNVVRFTDVSVEFDLDLDGVTTGDYDVVVTLLSGGEAVLEDGFTVDPTPLPGALDPASGFDNETLAVTLTGSRFQAGLSVALMPETGDPVPATVGTTTDTSVALTFNLLNAPLGTYDVRVVNPDGGENTLADAFTVERGPRTTSVSPLLGHDNEAARNVYVQGVDIVDGVTCVLQKTGEAAINGIVSNYSGDQFTSTFDLRDVEAGNWKLRVTNPDGGTWVHAQSFAVSRAPDISGLSPERGFDTETVSGFQVGGTDFVDGAALTLENGGGTQVTATGVSLTSPTILTGALPLTGVAPGTLDLRVTNPDGGTDTRVDAFHVLGTTILATGHASMDRPAVAYNPDRDEMFVVYSVGDGTQWDVRARRYDAVTGLPVGSEILVTDVSAESGGKEFQRHPAVAWSSSLSRYLVVYTWIDDNVEESDVKVLAQYVGGDGIVETPQGLAFSAFTSSAGVIGPPRVVWNPTDAVWLVVAAHDTDETPAIRFKAFDDDGILTANGLVPFETASGDLIAPTHSIPDPEEPEAPDIIITDAASQPDVAFIAATGEFAVSWTYDFTEDEGDADTGTDVRLTFIDGDLSGGVSTTGTVTNLGNVNNRDEGWSRLATGSGDVLVAWEVEDGSGGTDLRCWLVDGATRARVGSAATTVEATVGDDATRPAVAFDATSGAEGYVVAHSINAGASGTSRIETTRLPLSGGASSGLGTAVTAVTAGTESGTSHGAAAVAGRGVTGEIVVVWDAPDGNGDDGRIRFAR